MPPSVLDLPPRREVARSFYRRWTWRRQLRASGTRLLILAFVALLVWGGWYLANIGFGRQWRTTVADELRKIDKPSHWHIGDAKMLMKRAKSKTLAGWGRADQSLPKI